MRFETDVLVIGSGAAGLTAAIYLHQAGRRVRVLTKTDEATDCNTFCAQGGIIAAKAGDTPQSLTDDILLAGAHINNEAAVRYFSDNGPQLVFDFLINQAGIEFSKNDRGAIDYTEEAAHQVRRIVHYQDHTGEVIETGLVAYARRLGIPIQTNTIAIDLITNHHHSKDCQQIYKPREVWGCYALNSLTGEVDAYFADAVVLATGGVGNLFQHTTNPEAATGDGLAMAYRAGADIINAEFVQFHPTALFHRSIKRFLISESLRGEGARLIDSDGNQFMADYHPMKELAPRDIVARAIFDKMSQTGKAFIYLDLAHYYTGKEPIEKRFSKIARQLKEGGIDITLEPIPVVPAAHYFCGGIKVDTCGQTSVNRLYAVGEVSCTGLHGANRLASTSLLEAVLWGKSCAESIIAHVTPPSHGSFRSIPDWSFPSRIEAFEPVLIDQDMRALQATMWNYAGIVRTPKGLERAQADLNYYYHRIIKFYREAELNRSIIELRNAVECSQMIVTAALHNPVSVGCHFIKKEGASG